VILDPRSCDATHIGLLTAAFAVIASVAIATAHGRPSARRRVSESSAGQNQLRAMNACEKEIHMARRITAIINEDRRIEDL
jgi:hypothetical protein